MMCLSGSVSAQSYLRAYGADVRSGDVSFSPYFGPSRPACSVAASGSSIRTSNNATYQGSASQFAAVARGSISGFASSILRGISPSPAPNTPNGLNFANTLTPQGQYNSNCVSLQTRYFNPGPNGYRSTQLQNVSGQFRYDINSIPNETWDPDGPSPGGPLPPLAQGNIHFDSIPAGYGKPPAPAVVFTPDTSLLHLSGGETNAARQLYINGNVYIKENIAYTETGAVGAGTTWAQKTGTGGAGWSNAEDVPSLQIIAKGDIFIDQNVTRLDGTYTAHGTLYTCSVNGAVPTAAQIATNCNKQLVVNGSLTSYRIKFLRSYGAVGQGLANEQPYGGAASSCPGGAVNARICAGEVIIFGPEVYLPGLRLEKSTNLLSIKYDYITALPPVL